MRRRFCLAAIAALAITLAPAPARAWDSRTHRLITRLAVGALPNSSLQHALAVNEDQLQENAVAPDTILRLRNGKAEAIRHYIDLEDYGAEPFAALNPDRSAMIRQYGVRRLEQSGTLPWTIEETAAGIGDAWRKGDCARMLLLSGHLSHYVGDASQPLHSTVYFDGYRQDRGAHARLEDAVDHSIGEVERQARPLVHPLAIEGVWPAALAEIKRAHPLVQEVIEADRAARAEAGDYGPANGRALMRRQLAMVARQVADAASTLAAIWLYEWRQAGSPVTCS